MRGWMLVGLLTAAGVGILLLTTTEGRRWLRPMAVGLGLLPPRHEMDVYRARLAAFARENERLTAPCIVLLGDSLSEGFPAADASRLGLVNRGISGDRVADLARRLDSSVLQTPCQQVLILGGSNDIVLDHAEPARVATALLEVAERAAASGRHVMLMSLPPTAGPHAPAHERVREYNRLLETAARERGFGWADLHRALGASDGGETKALDPDGLHLSEDGYESFRTLVESPDIRAGAIR